MTIVRLFCLQVHIFVQLKPTPIIARTTMALVGTFFVLEPGNAQQAPLPPQGRVFTIPEVGLPERAGAESSAGSPRPLRLDGLLDEPWWSQAETVELPFEVNIGTNAAAPVRTTCRLARDASMLFLGCEATDPAPGRIRAYLTGRDNLDNQDAISLTLDPFGTARRAYSFLISPLGVQGDGVLDVQAGYDPSWDGVWGGAGRVHERGYTVEAAIPFNTIRFPAPVGREARWLFFIQRVWPRDAVYMTRSRSRDPGSSCALCESDSLAGIRGIDPGSHVELTPTVTAGLTQRRAVPGSSFEDATTRDLGFDARWNPASNLTISGTVNPDFSQVEADAPQLDVNTRFSLSYPERRPFFQEGAEIFSTLISTVFTRSIADPEVGLKLTGTVGPYAGGLLAARDARTNLLLPSAALSTTTGLSGASEVAALRLRRDIGSSLSVGIIGTARTGEAYSNAVGGLDGYWRPFQSLTLRTQAAYTRTRYPDELEEAGAFAGSEFNGNTFRIVARYDTRDWRAQTTYSTRSPGYRADVGFEPQVDLRYVDAWAFRHFYGPPNGWYKRIFVGLGIVREDDYGYRPIDHWGFVNVGWDGPRQLNVSASYRPWRQWIGGKEHDITSLYSTITFRPNRLLNVQLYGLGGHAVDFVGNRRVRETRVRPALTLRPGVHLEVGISHDWQRLTLPAGMVLAADLTQLRTVYAFNPRAAVRAILQRREVSRNPALNPGILETHSTSILSQILFSYRVDPQKALYVGYGDTWRGQTEQGAEVEPSESPLIQTSRTLFLKFAHAWRP